MGISSSSRADLADRLDALGTNRLQIQAGTSFTPGATAALGDDAGRHGPPDRARSSTRAASRPSPTPPCGAARTSRRPRPAASACRPPTPTSPTTIGAPVADGRFLSAADVATPTIVLGADAAATPRHPRPRPRPDGLRVRALVHRRRHPAPVPRSTRTSTPPRSSASRSPTRLFDTAAAPSSVFVVTDKHQVDAVRAVLPATANPESPGEVQVSRPSDAIAAKQAADDTLTALFLGLGAVALLVGGIGIANVMVISVLERRTEIGVRRALGATRHHVRSQFLVEAVLLSAPRRRPRPRARRRDHRRVQRGAVDHPLRPGARARRRASGPRSSVGALAGLSPAGRRRPARTRRRDPSRIGRRPGPLGGWPTAAPRVAYLRGDARPGGTGPFAAPVAAVAVVALGACSSDGGTASTTTTTTPGAEPLHILVTNDDGYAAPGIDTVARRSCGSPTSASPSSRPRPTRAAPAARPPRAWSGRRRHPRRTASGSPPPPCSAPRRRRELRARPHAPAPGRRGVGHQPGTEPRPGHRRSPAPSARPSAPRRVGSPRSR